MLRFPLRHGLFSKRHDFKICIANSLLVVGCTLVASIAVYILMRPQIESALSRSIEITLKNKVHFFENQIEAGWAETSALATHPLLVEVLQQLNAEPDSDHAMRGLKQKMHSLHLAGITATTVFNINGNEVMQKGYLSQNQTEKFPMHAHHDLFLAWDDNELILHVKKDVLDHYELPIGSITTEKRLPQLTSYLREINEIGKSAELKLCETLEVAGQEMVCLLSNADFIKFERMPRDIKETKSLMSYALDGKSGMVTTNGYRQTPVVASFTPVSSLGMALILDKEEFCSAMSEQEKTIAALLFVLIITGLLLLFWLVLPLMRKLARSEKKAQERLKECQCLHGIRRDMERNLQEEEFYQKVIVRLIKAMQFPEITSVMIKLGDKRFVSDQYDRDLMHRLQAQILVNGDAYGWLYVIYSEERPFWLPEEQDLIDTIASDLGRWIEQKQTKQRITQMATHDGLTGLPNRYLLHDRIKQVLAHDRRTHEQAAVLFVDLDRFKSINDSQGHAIGDLLLQEVAARLTAIIRSADTVARHGGDEFIILLQNIKDSQEVKVVAQKILNKLAQPFYIHGKELHIGGSIGIALFPHDGDDVETLLRNSDIAMYHAKKSGRNSYWFSSPEMNPK
ncbi:GGDEF domain-containing protein [Nitrosomonas communis]|uniref:Diguanylate cyclase (GGDEF) domain-containing protein n=1 Tax=Nitrosomonas communis TaxID=44574 RepID=A0A1H2X3Z5_9PROT|nr:GGDEF domain-containing protein [Nitrosomonas communis]SDW87508.1 diguanylate cyclase (GGDEF) domain-containing protein [Nitrosomonas communis]